MSIFERAFNDTFDYHKRDDEVCGKCRHHCGSSRGWYCANERSDFYSNYTEYGNRCDEFEERD